MNHSHQRFGVPSRMRDSKPSYYLKAALLQLVSQFFDAFKSKTSEFSICKSLISRLCTLFHINKKLSRTCPACAQWTPLAKNSHQKFHFIPFKNARNSALSA